IVVEADRAEAQRHQQRRDDYLKVTKQSHMGFSGKERLGIEFVIAGIAVYFMMRTAIASGIAGSTFGSSIAFPFFKDFMI
ncbi:hypothetical protein ACC687_41315, partial [Rhizobium ruizarguesonis]